MLNTAFCQTNGAVNAVVIDSVNNVVYIGGSFSQVCGTARSRLAALDLNTGALLSWNPGANNDVYSLHVYNNALYVGGFFTTCGGQARKYTAKFYLPSGALSSWDPGIASGSHVRCFASRGSKVYLGGSFFISGASGNNLCELDTGTAAASAWGNFPNGFQVEGLAIAANQLYVGGDFTQIGTTSISYLAKYYITGTGTATISAWNPAPDAQITSLCLQGGRLFVSGGFSFLGTDNREKIAEVDTSTGAATAWNPGSDGAAFDLEYRNGILYMCGNFSTVGSKLRNFIAAVDATTGITTSWSVNCNASTWDLATTAGNLHIGGSFNSMLSQTRNNFAVVCINPIDTMPAAPAGQTSVCAGLSGVSYSVAPVSGATSYVWSYSGTGVTINGTSNSITVDFSASATSGDLTVYGTNGCQSTNTMTLSISTYSFSASVTGTSYIVCGDSTALSVSDNYAGSGSVSYSWSPATALTATNQASVMSGAKSDITYTATATSTDGCVATSEFTLTVAPITLSLSTGQASILCSTHDTIFVSNDYPGTGAISYTWTPSSTLNLSNPVKVIASPVVSTVYFVTASSTDGCAAPVQSISVNVTPLTLSASASASTITCGNTSTLGVSTNYPGSGTITYTWSPAGSLSSASIASPVASPTSSTSYNVDILTPEGCLSSGSVSVNVNPLQIITGGMYVSTCGAAVTLTTSNNSGNSNLTYSWSPANGLSSATAASPLANPGTTTIYSVTMSLSGTGCADAYGIDTVQILAPAVPSICAVTVDDSSKNNVIYWDKTAYQPTDSFIVYRETTTGVYMRIAALPHGALSEYTDTARSIGPANGDPNVGTYRYKLQVKDSCGNVSQPSPYHNSVFFVDNNNGTFTWNTYAVEGATTPVTQFDLMRDDLNNGVWVLVGSVAGTQTTLNDPQYALHQSLANWRVEAQGFNCTSTQRQGNAAALGTLVKSKSNITNNRVIGVKENALSTVSVYPNPSAGRFMIVLGEMKGSTNVRVVSLLGETVYTSRESQANISLDLGTVAAGTYFLHIANEGGSIIRKIVKN